MKAWVVVSLLCFVSSACSKKDDVSLAPAASGLAVSKSDAATSWHFTIDPNGSTHIEMPGLKETIVGDTTAAAGKIDIVPSDLAASRGVVRIDLSTFATHTFGNDKDATQTKHARTWLEVLEVPANGKVEEDKRWADFAIRSIDGLSAPDLGKVTPSREGDEDVRRVTLTAHGDLLVHGHRVEKDAALEVAFRYPASSAAVEVTPYKPGASGAVPTKIGVTSTHPMRVVLKEHDVQPRDPAGKLADWTANLVAKVADTADVSVNLSATPVP